MRTIMTLWFITSTTACAGAASVAPATEPAYPVDSISEAHEQALAACEEEPAHITRAEYGNRPIIVDGVTVYCF